MSPYIVIFQSSILGLALSLDSRGYVLFSFLIQGQDGWRSLPAGKTLTCEYLVDVVNLSGDSMNWIIQNCDEIKEGEIHLYFKWKGFIDGNATAPGVS